MQPLVNQQSGKQYFQNPKFLGGNPTQSKILKLDPTLLRPKTTAVLPVRSRPAREMSSIQPRGVQGTKISVSPRDNLPAVIVVKPSTSLFSEMYSVTFSPSIPRSWKDLRSF